MMSLTVATKHSNEGHSMSVWIVILASPTSLAGQLSEGPGSHTRGYS